MSTIPNTKHTTIIYTALLAYEEALDLSILTMQVLLEKDSLNPLERELIRKDIEDGLDTIKEIKVLLSECEFILNKHQNGENKNG